MRSAEPDNSRSARAEKFFVYMTKSHTRREIILLYQDEDSENETSLVCGDWRLDNALQSLEVVLLLLSEDLVFHI